MRGNKKSEDEKRLINNIKTLYWLWEKSYQIVWWLF